VIVAIPYAIPAIIPYAIPAIISFSLAHVFLFFIHVILPSTPTPPIFALQIFLDSLFFGPFFFQRRNKPKTMRYFSGNISGSRNRCSVNVGGVGVEGMMTLREAGTLV